MGRRAFVEHRGVVQPVKRTEKIKSRVDPDAANAQLSGVTTAPVGTPDNPSNNVVTLPNVITLCRLILTGVFLWLFVTGHDRNVALCCYAVAAITDFVDGALARATQSVSWVGKIMDPVMDRVLLFVGVLGLVLTGELPVWIAVFVIGRDVYLAVGGLILQHYRHRPIDVVFIGKLTTTLLLVGFCALLLGQPELPGLGLWELSFLPGFGSRAVCWGIWPVYLGVITSTITAIIYTLEGFYFRRESIAGRDVESADSSLRAREELRGRITRGR